MDEDEKRALLDRGATTDSVINENGFTDLTEEERKTFVRTRNSLVAAAVLVLLGISVGIIIAVVVNKPEPGKAVSQQEVLNGTLAANRQSIRWIVQEGQDGISTYSQNSNIFVWQPPFTDNERKLVVTGSDVIDPETNAQLVFADYWIAPNQAFVLYATNYTKVWRHSFTARYYVWDVAAKTIVALDDPQVPIQLAVWSPDSASIAYVRNNNLWIYSVNTQTRTQVTNDGSIDILNGVPSWVYEEEVFGTNSALWWSPDGRTLAYMKSDESAVPIFTYPIYRDDSYPTQILVKYPKSGYENPTWSVVVYAVDTMQSGTVNFNFADERYLVDLAWCNSNSFLARVVPRVQSSSALFFVDATTPTNPLATQVSSQTRENGWIDYAQLLPITNGGQIYYLDIIDSDGYNQLALYSLEGLVHVLTGKDATTPYEVVSIAGYNAASQTAFVLTTHQGPSELHLYSISVFDETAVPVRVSPEGEGYYTASFSSLSGYYLLNYDGPSVPKQFLMSIPSSSENLNITIELNDALATTLSGYAMPKYIYFNTTINGEVLNAVMMVPERFDEANKGQYPVLLRVYGGPASQLVLKRYSVDWHTYLVSSLGYIVVMMDARGTSGRGNAFKNSVYKHLGDFEAQDQLAMGAYMKGQKYVDTSRIYVWGWSYGGYLTSKILEADSTDVFAGGIAVAPVTDWRFYDTIYTERYMLEPAQNPDGYTTSAVANFTNLYSKRYLLVHGTADDNVHYQHAAVLIYKLVSAGVPFEMFAYTDSDHRINTGPNTSNDLYTRLTEFLQGE